MSDELKRVDGKRLNWVPITVFSFAVAGAYQGAHYATAAVGHTPGACMGYCTHKVGGKEVPAWMDEYFFWPAQRFDDAIGVNPWSW
jgi:hypothetical protein